MNGTERTLIAHAEDLKKDIEAEFKPREVDYRSGIDVEYQRKEYNFKLLKAMDEFSAASNRIKETLGKKSNWEQAYDVLQNVSETKHRLPRDVYYEVGDDEKTVVSEWNK